MLIKKPMYNSRKWLRWSRISLHRRSFNHWVEGPLEKGMATHFSILAWRIPWIEEPGGLITWDHKESDMTERLTLSLFQVQF